MINNILLFYSISVFNILTLSIFGWLYFNKLLILNLNTFKIKQKDVFVLSIILFECFQCLVRSKASFWKTHHLTLHRLHAFTNIKDRMGSKWTFILLLQLTQFLCGKWMSKILFRSFKSLKIWLTFITLNYNHFWRMFGTNKIIAFITFLTGFRILFSIT